MEEVEEENKKISGTSTEDAIVLDDCGDSTSDGVDDGYDGDLKPSPRCPALPTHADDSLPRPHVPKRARREEDNIDVGSGPQEGGKADTSFGGAAATAARSGDRTYNTSNTPSAPRNYIIRPCPIKLMATKQDEDMHKLHNDDHWSYRHCWTLREMLRMDRHPGDEDAAAADESIQWVVISNFLVDFQFLLHEIPELMSIPTVLVVYNHADDNTGMETWKQMAAAPGAHVDFVRRDPSDPKRSPANPLPTSMPHGCHHTKLFLVGYSSGRMRVIVHTSNLRFNDVHLKCQGAFLQDFWPKSEDQEFSTSDFEETMISYISSYRFLERRPWQQSQKAAGASLRLDNKNHNHSNEPCSLMDQISKYDFSTARGVLIPSVPGFHAPPNNNHPGSSCWGYLRVRRAISQQIKHPLSRAGGAIVCQFSSIGSLSEKYLKSLWEAWDVNSVLRKFTTTAGVAKICQEPRQPCFQLVYPTYEEIVSSVEGRSGGGSVPGSSKNVGKPFLQNLYHKWTSSRKTTCPSEGQQQQKQERRNKNKTMGKGLNVPHIKTYYQMIAGKDEEDHLGNSSDVGMQWFVVGSQNLSKAAWGELQNGLRGPTFKVFHWELGVFISPQTLNVDRLVPFGRTADHHLLRPTPATTSGPPPVNETLCEVPLPYPFRPERHSATDRAWTLDMLYNNWHIEKRGH